MRSQSRSYSAAQNCSAIARLAALRSSVMARTMARGLRRRGQGSGLGVVDGPGAPAPRRRDARVGPLHLGDAVLPAPLTAAAHDQQVAGGGGEVDGAPAALRSHEERP